MSVSVTYCGKNTTESKAIFDRCYLVKNMMSMFDSDSKDYKVNFDEIKVFERKVDEEEFMNETVTEIQVVEAILDYLRHHHTQETVLYYGENGDKEHPDNMGGYFLKEPSKHFTEFDKNFANSKSMYFLWKISVAADKLQVHELLDVCGRRLAECFESATEDFEDSWLDMMTNPERNLELMGWFKKSTAII